MKGSKCFIRTRLFCTIVILLFYGTAFQSFAQYPGIDEEIAKNRKGEIVIKAKPGAQVTVEQIRHEFSFGSAIANGFINGSMSDSDRDQYEEKFLKNFNSAVTENAVKWLSMEREKGKVDYSVVDGMLAWSEKNNIPLRGHNLFWGIHKFVQPWLMEMDDAELRKTLQHRAESVTKRYAGRFAEYDLNNEMVHGNFYEERLGPEITKDMAAWAHNGDPKAKLYVNDYDILTGKKLPEYMAQIRKLLSQGVPIAGIGVQGHLHSDTFDRNELRRALDSLAIFKLPIKITEFNIPGQRSKYHVEKILTMTPEEEALKAKELVDFYRICFAHPAVEGILMWGFWEGANWIPVSSLYKRDWSPTPAANAYGDLIFKTWWTKTKGTTNKKGVYSTPAFFGKYKVTVDGKSKEIELSKKQGKVTVDF